MNIGIGMLAAVSLCGCAAVSLCGCAAVATRDDAKPAHVQLLAHRGVHQAFDRRGVERDTCTAARMLPPTHGHLENTIASMRAAFDAGADRVEFDIHPTTDGSFAVFHDWTVDCRTDGRGVTREQSMASLKTLDIGHGYTADGGATYPFRGKFRGAMPSWPEVMAAFPGKRFLVNVKSNSAEEGRAIAAFVKARGYDLTLLAFSGADRPMDAIREAFPGALVQQRRELKRCMIGYAALGWFGHVPESCRNTLVYVPENYTWLLAGWPHTFVERMAALGSGVYLIGPLHDNMSQGFDDASRLPPGYRGGVMTDRIEVVGPALRPAR
jgi:glycerophosphoryl diester phosphodiesterase